jgi:hypothetical protein
MKNVPALIGLIVWMLLTILLTFSVVGMLLFIPKDGYSNSPDEPSTWMHVGRELLDKVTSN